ncbi:hypothetical protein EQ875_01229 [Photobacterium damselae subsp. damselae]|uniref:Uncharacterized protein n=1 Tax=Photobacterium damselae TaxID=38293 RepID=A0A2X1ZN06_PHODM|nr:hypothetical protein EQ875_01229 [Photobacterium damselae subsp. damselae]SPY30101.1 Uncharacterised protein [Photobacterium damselae]SPY44746.1 Uncharacterised protein [Photobacterium damselae]SUB90238.1 Uncharacterised protein [Photobacterium damselae]
MAMLYQMREKVLLVLSVAAALLYLIDTHRA